MKLLNNFKLFTTLQIFCCLLPFYGFGQVVPVTSQTQTVTQPYNTSGHAGFLGLGAVNTETAQSSALYFFTPQKQLHLKQFVLRRSSPATTDVPTVRLTAIGVGGQNWNPGGGGGPEPEGEGPNGLYSINSDFNDWFENAQHHWDMEGRTNGFSILHTPHGQTVQNRFNITSTGLIGIAEQSPLSRLHVRGINELSDTIISRFVSVNGTNALGIGKNSLIAIGSSANQSIYLRAKGTGGVGVGVEPGQPVKGNFQVVGKSLFGISAPPQSATNNGVYTVAVDGDLYATRILVISKSGWADDVFEPGYQLPSLKETEIFIKKNKRLPGVLSEKEVMENGLDLKASDAVLLRKIEELTLHLIELSKEVESLKKQIK